jgi:hypothetical protein
MQRASVRRCWIGLASATACFAVPVVADRALAERFAFVNSINRTVQPLASLSSPPSS